jgi:hypothetical protein
MQKGLVSFENQPILPKIFLAPFRAFMPHCLALLTNPGLLPSKQPQPV